MRRQGVRNIVWSVLSGAIIAGCIFALRTALGADRVWPTVMSFIGGCAGMWLMLRRDDRRRR